jgi:hypothetical protein
MLEVTTAQAASVVAAALLGVVIAFQLALAGGAPWGHLAYGGRAAQSDGRLRRGHRLASGVTCIVLAGASWVVLAAGAVIDRGPLSAGTLRIITWVLAVLFLLNTAGNAAGRHPLERWGAGTVTALLSILCVLIAVRG